MHINHASWRLRFCRNPNFKKPSYACLRESYWAASFVLPAPKRSQQRLWFVALCSVAPPSVNWTLPAVFSWLQRPLSIWRPSDALSSHLSARSNGISDSNQWHVLTLRWAPTKRCKKRLWKSSPRFGSHCDSVSQPSLPQSPPNLSPAKAHSWSKTKNISDKNETMQVQESDWKVIPTAKLPPTQTHSKTLKMQHIPHHFPCLLLQICNLCLSRARLFHLCPFQGPCCSIEAWRCWLWLPSSSSPRGCLVALSR